MKCFVCSQVVCHSLIVVQHSVGGAAVDGDVTDGDLQHDIVIV